MLICVSAPLALLRFGASAPLRAPRGTADKLYRIENRRGCDLITIPAHGTPVHYYNLNVAHSLKTAYNYCFIPDIRLCHANKNRISFSFDEDFEPNVRREQ
jgi:hypothetical protein